jgi:hypothetical protein
VPLLLRQAGQRTGRKQKYGGLILRHFRLKMT